MHRKPNTSVFDAVEVRVGAVPPAHLIVLKKTTFLLPVPSCPTLITKAETAGFEIVNVVVAAERVVENIFETPKSKPVDAKAFSLDA